MKKLSLVLMMSVALAVTATLAQAGQNGNGNGNGNGHKVGSFIDEDGDGFNDLAPDADGDGIPNGLDADFVKPKDGTGKEAKQARFAGVQFGPGMMMFQGSNGNRGSGHGPGNGGGFGGDGPADGGGFGPGTGTGTGDCDATGPNGQPGGAPDRGNRR